MSERLAVDEPVALFEFLASKLEGWHRNTLRERLRQGCVLVNDETTTRRDHALETGDVLLVKEALHHRSITSTLVYARADEERLRRALG